MPPNRLLPPELLADTGHMLAHPKPLGEGWLRPDRTPGAVNLPAKESGNSSAPHGGRKLWHIARVFIIVVLLILSGLYFWGASLNSQDVKGPQSGASAANS